MNQTPLQDSLMDYGENGYFNAALMQEIENHLPLLKQSNAIYAVPIEPAKAYEHQYNFYGLLQDLNVPAKLYWTVLRLNDMETPEEFNKQLKQVFLIQPEIVDTLRSLMASRYV